MIPHLGGDEKERQLLALLATLNARDQDGFAAMTPGSQIVLLTDAPSHNVDHLQKVIDQAVSQNVCINFFLSITRWEGYWRIANETGGTVVSSIHQTSVREFNRTHSAGQCADHYGLKYVRQKRSLSSPNEITEKCKYFNTSLFTTKVIVTVDTTQDFMRVTKPDGNDVHMFSNPQGEKIFHESAPQSGQYSVCVEDGTLTITVEKTENMSTIVQYLNRVENSTEVFLRRAPPPACKCYYNRRKFKG